MLRLEGKATKDRASFQKEGADGRVPIGANRRRKGNAPEKRLVGRGPLTKVVSVSTKVKLRPRKSQSSEIMAVFDVRMM